MGTKTGISWTDATWNCIRGCSRVSPGCVHCYAETMAGRFCGPGQPYEGLAERRLRVIDGDTERLVPRWTGVVRMVPEHLADPLRWLRPRRIFVNSMSDLFHEKLTNEEIAAVYGVMAAAGRHIFQVLTKRAPRRREWFMWIAKEAVTRALSIAQVCLSFAAEALYAAGEMTWGSHLYEVSRAPGVWPLPNVWEGTSVENQPCADDRIPELLQTPAAIRFLSCEPLLGPVDIRRWLIGEDECQYCGVTSPATDDDACPQCKQPGHMVRVVDGEAFENAGSLHWVIAGCESGPGARPCDAAWLRSLRDQCAATDTAFFLKQAVSPYPEMHADPTYWVHPQVHERRDLVEGPGSKRKARGVIELPYLDGVRHVAMPGDAAA